MKHGWFDNQAYKQSYGFRPDRWEILSIGISPARTSMCITVVCNIPAFDYLIRLAIDNLCCVSSKMRVVTYHSCLLTLSLIL